MKNKSLFDVFKAVAFIITAILIGTTLGSKLANAQTVVAVLDTGKPRNPLTTPCKTGHKDFTGTEIYDNNGHATNLDSLLAQSRNKSFCTVFIKVFDGYANWMLEEHLEALRYLRDEVKPDYLLLAQSGNKPISEEISIFKQLLDNGTKFSVAAGNEGSNLGRRCSAFPACYKFDNPNYRVVGWTGKGSNYSGPVKTYVHYVGKVGTPKRSGTSQASAIYLRRWLDSDK